MTPIPNDLYDVRLYDHDGSLFQILRKWDRIQYTQRTNGPWNHFIELRVASNDPIIETILNLKKHFFVIITRIDPYSLDTDLVYEGLHQTAVIQLTMSKVIIISLYGAGYASLLSKRVVVPPTGLENSEKNGYAEDIIKSFVFESAVQPTELVRQLQGMKIANSQSRGNLDTYSARYTKLDSVIEAISERNLLDFGVYGGAELGEFIFDCKPVWGTDRREGNAEGNTPVIFDVEKGNMSIPILSINHRNEVNFVYVGGQGQGVDREIITVSDPESIAESPWGRSEAFTDAKQEDAELALQGAGLAYLRKNRSYEDFTFEIEQISSSRWLRDYVLGDYVTGKFLGRRYDKKIKEVAVTVSPISSSSKIEDITIEMEDV